MALSLLCGALCGCSGWWARAGASLKGGDGAGTGAAAGTGTAGGAGAGTARGTGTGTAGGAGAGTARGAGTGTGAGAAAGTGAGGSRGGGASGDAYVAGPAVNSAIYSNDYILDEGPVKGGSIRIYATQPDTFNPLLTRNVYTSAMFWLVYESLARIGPGYAVVPWLAEGWTPSDDGLSWSVMLRGGMKWHDGNPLRAQDVADTISKIQSYGSYSPYAGLVANIESVSVISELELRLSLKKENANTPYTFLFPVVPSHIMVDALDGLSGGANLGVSLIGSGPYRYRNYVSGSSIIFTNAESWRGGADVNTGASADASIGASADMGAGASAGAGAKASPPYIRDVIFMFHDPSETALVQFRKRGVDVFFSRNFDYAQYRTSSELRIRHYAEREFMFVAMNCSGGMTGAGSVRRALVRMADRRRFVDEALGGRGIPAEFPVHPDSPLYEGGIVKTPHDVQAARSILENAGFRLDEGIFYGDVGNGWNKLELAMLVDESDAVMCGAADQFARMLYDCGVVIKVLREKEDAIMQKVSAGQYEMALLNYRIQPFPDMTELYSTPWDDGSGAQANPAHYRNEDADRLSHELFMIYDALDAQTAFSELVTIIRDDAPYIGLCFRASSLVFGEDLRGDIYAGAWNPLNFFESWYIADYR